jgi:uncharacterized membrane protein
LKFERLLVEKLKSRKFWFALLGAILPIVAQALSEDIALADAITLSVGVVVAYIWGQGYVDGNTALPASE